MSDQPDFLQRNGAWVLSVLGICGTCGAATLAYFLKSRCTRISCLGFSCERDPLPADQVLSRSRSDAPRERESDSAV